MSLQDELNRVLGTTGRTKKDCLNILAGKADLSLDSTTAANTWAETTGLRLQDAINAEAGSTGLTKQDAAKLIPIIE
jgi:hypothetical protein